MHDPTDLTGAEGRDAEEQKQAEILAAQDLKDFRQLMGTAWGRRIVWGLLAKSGAFRQSFTTNGAVTSFNEGQRSVGLVYLDMINLHCLDEYVLMLQERNANVN